MVLKRDLLLTGVILAVIGILFLAAPTSSALVVASVVGIILMLMGLARGYGALKTKEKTPTVKMILALSLILIVLGIFILVDPGFLVAYSYVIFGVVMIVNALSNIVGVVKGDIRVRDSKTLYLVISAALAVLGVIILFNPFSASDVMMRIIGVMLIADGIVDLVMALRMPS